MHAIHNINGECHCASITSFCLQPLFTQREHFNHHSAMWIFAKTLTGQKFPLEVEGSTSVHEAKQIIFTLTGLPPSQQRLVFEGVELSDGHTLNDYPIAESSLLLIIRRVPFLVLNEALTKLTDNLEDLRGEIAGWQKYEKDLDDFTD